jgi:phosphoketolase
MRDLAIKEMVMDVTNTLLSVQELSLIDRYWRAANYLSVGQIYLMDIRCCASR